MELDKSSLLPYLSYSIHFERLIILMSTSESPNTADLTFEEALDRLEDIVESLEDDPPSLDEALDTYEEGVALANDCLSRLDEAEQRVSELTIGDES
jgi:exodeoxyribonuclease VII small subunit